MRDVKELLKNTFGMEPAKKAPPAPPPAQAPAMPTQPPETKPGVSPDAMAAIQSMVWKDGALPSTQAPAPVQQAPAPPGNMADAGTVGALNPAKGWGQV